MKKSKTFLFQKQQSDQNARLQKNIIIM